MAKVNVTGSGRKSSSVNEKMFEVAGSTSIGEADAPGTSNGGDIHFEELGRLSDFPSVMVNDNPIEGTGEWCVVLADYLSGAGEEDHFGKGHVRRISRLVPGYSDTEVDRGLVKGRIRRLLETKAIRLATRDEVGNDKVIVTLDSERDDMHNERQRRINAEQENTLLRERLGLAHDAQVAATPNQAGASDEAQQAAVDENVD